MDRCFGWGEIEGWILLRVKQCGDDVQQCRFGAHAGRCDRVAAQDALAGLGDVTAHVGECCADHDQANPEDGVVLRVGNICRSADVFDPPHGGLFTHEPCAGARGPVRVPSGADRWALATRPMQWVEREVNERDAQTPVRSRQSASWRLPPRGAGYGDTSCSDVERRLPAASAHDESCSHWRDGVHRCRDHEGADGCWP